MAAKAVFVSVLFWFNVCYVTQASYAERQEEDLTYMAFLTSFEHEAHGVVCSGTIIHERFVLTAANCFYSSTGEPISYQHKVLIASDYKDIQRLIPHPRYFLQTWANDVGLIELAEKIVFGPYVSKMVLAKNDDLHVGDKAYTTCWVLPATELGINLYLEMAGCFAKDPASTMAPVWCRETKQSKSSFQEESVEIVPRRHCGRAPYYGRYIFNNMTCAVANNTCTVDSGAPLLRGGRQHAVASRQHGWQLLFTNTFRLRWWIANIVFGEHMDEYFASYMI